MYDTLLFPTDGGEGAATALDHALDVADAHDTTVHLLHVVNATANWSGTETVDERETEGQRLVRDAADRAGDRGVSTVTEVRRGEPYAEITDYARAPDVDLVVMPTHGRRGSNASCSGASPRRSSGRRRSRC